MRRVTLEKLKDCEVPWARETIETLETRTCRKLVQDAQRVLSKSIASDRLTILAHDFWKASCKKEIISSRCFIASVRKVLARADCKCERNNHSTCNIRQCYSVPLSLLQLLVHRLCLHAEARTNSLHHSTLFDHWYSEEESDLAFGAEGSMMEKSLAGRNSMLQYCPEREDKEEFSRIYSRIIDQISSKSPTRCTWIVPTSHITEVPTPHRRALLEIARFPQELPLIPPGSYRNQQRGDSLWRAPQAISIVIALNKESMLRDPIDWPVLKEELRSWSNEHCSGMVIPELTDQLFRERTCGTHSPRVRSVPLPSVSSMFQFFDAWSPSRNDTQYLKSRGLNQGEAALVQKINRHNKFLSVLGILPNQLRKLMKDSCDNTDEVILDLKKTLFFAGYGIWKRRKVLMNDFWRNIAPEEWKKNSKKAKKKKANASLCNNPFHFLKKHSNLSRQKPTRCGCSMPEIAVPLSVKSRDIRTFLTRFLPIQSPDVGFSNVSRMSRERFSVESSEVSNSHDYRTRTDRVRSEHDRGKKRRSVRF